jgi:hypothetical protein
VVFTADVADQQADTSACLMLARGSLISISSSFISDINTCNVVNILSLVLDRTGFPCIRKITAFHYANRYFVGPEPHAHEHSTILQEKSKISTPITHVRCTRDSITPQTLHKEVKSEPHITTRTTMQFNSSSVFGESVDSPYTQVAESQSQLDSIPEQQSTELYPHSGEVLPSTADLDENSIDDAGSFSHILIEPETAQQERIVKSLPFPKTLKRTAVFNTSCFNTGEIDVLLILSSQCYIILETKRSVTKHSFSMAKKQAVKYCQVFEILRPGAAIFGIVATYNHISIVYDNDVSNSVTPLLEPLFELLEHNRV